MTYDFEKLVSDIKCPVWDRFLTEEIAQPYFIDLKIKLCDEYVQHKVFPEFDDILNAYRYTSYSDTKVLILGQDPYHEVGQATGLAFGVQAGIKIPPSLKNIFKEITRDYGTLETETSLKHWANQGVMLLNSTLTVRESKANSHKKLGWGTLVYNTLKLLAKKQNLVIMLWGNPSISKSAIFDETKHLILTSSHPSPLSVYRGFDGCGHFRLCNEHLVDRGQNPIQW